MNTKPPSSRPKVALIAGPTASGKSALAMRVASAVDGVVVNADSAQVYRDLRVLSARPGEAEETAVPHRLFGYIDGAEACSAARWAGDAGKAIAEAHGQGKLPVLAGGTGLYHRTLLDGIAPIPEIDPEIRAAVRALPVAETRRALEAEDPRAAARLAPGDTTRIARALEVIRSTGRPIGEWRRERTGGIAGEIDLVPLVLLPGRDWLYARCDARAAEMFEGGAIDEVEALVARKLNPNLPVMRAIGVAEIAGLLAGERSREEALDAVAQATRRYAKRQFTWFSRQPPADWPRAAESDYDKMGSELIRKLR